MRSIIIHDRLSIARECDRNLFTEESRTIRGLTEKFQRHPVAKHPSLFLPFPPFFPLSRRGRNVNRGRDILQRGHGVRAWNQFKSCSPGRDREARERARSFLNLICTYTLRKPIPFSRFFNLERFLFQLLDNILSRLVAIHLSRDGDTRTRYLAAL